MAVAVFQKRSWLLLAVLAGLGCATTTPEYRPDRVALEHQQWKTVEQQAPLVGEALLLSLAAFSEPDPQSAAYARQQAIDLARRTGVVTAPRTSCNACELPKTEGELPNHMSCLIERINCLNPR